MHKILAVVSMVAAFAFVPISANACPFGEKSASLTEDKVAVAPQTSTRTAVEGMSTFDPKHNPVFEDVAKEPVKSPTVKTVSE